MYIKTIWVSDMSTSTTTADHPQMIPTVQMLIGDTLLHGHPEAMLALSRRIRDAVIAAREEALQRNIGPTYDE